MEWSPDTETMDIKIGAVFSLAQEEEVSFNPETTPTFQPANTSTESNDITPTFQPIETSEESSLELPMLNAPTAEDSDDEEEYFIPFGQSEPELARGSDTSSVKSRTVDGIERSLTDSTPSDLLDGDCPPSLSLEPAPPGGPGGWYGEEDMLPPVLERERLEVATSQAPGDSVSDQATVSDPAPRRKCTNISPSYLVLTNLRRFMEKKDTRVSWRRFKRRFKECTNMCKKVYFRRRLAAGKDVFNVLTPGKQKLYQLYLDRQEFDKQREGTSQAADKAGKPSPKFEKKTLNFPRLLAMYDKMKEKEVRGSGVKSSAAKKRRQIQHVPKDFLRKLTGDEQEDAVIIKKLTQDEQQERERRERLQKYLHSRELANLKDQIRMKRLANKRMKKYKKSESEKEKTFVDFVTGTSMKGRKRKSTTKYGPEFALTKTHEGQLHTMAMFAKRMKQMEKEQIRRKAKLERRMSGQDRDIDLVIDNPEKKNVKKIKLTAGDFLSQAKDKLHNKAESKLETGPMHDSGKKSSSRSSKKPPRGAAASQDGVLIRDLPSDEQLISGILGGSDATDPPVSHEQKPQPPVVIQAAVAIEHESSDSYPYARSLLNSSSVSKTDTASRNDAQNLKAKFSNPNATRLTHEMEMDRVKKLRIPERVQKLFKVKTEPVDPDYPDVQSHSAPVPTTATVAQSPAIPAYSTASEKLFKIGNTATSATTPRGTEKQPYKMIPPSLVGSPNSPTPLKRISPKRPVVVPSLFRQPVPSPGHPPLLPKAVVSPPVPITFVNGDKRIKVLVSSGTSVPSTQLTQAQCAKTPTMITNFPAACFSQPAAVSKPGVVTLMYPSASSQAAPVVSKPGAMTVMYPSASSSGKPVISKQGAMTVMYPSMKSSGHQVISATTNPSGGVLSYADRQGVMLMSPSTQSQSRVSTSHSTQSQATASFATLNPSYLTSQITSQLSSQSTIVRPNSPRFAKQVATPSTIPSISPSAGQARPVLATPPAASTTPTRTQTAPVVTAAAQPMKSLGVAEKCKFYLLKVDGKNILIPMNPGQSGTPTAFVVGNDVALKASITQPGAASGQQAVVGAAHAVVNSEQQPTAKLTKLPIPKSPGSLQSMTPPKNAPLLKLTPPGRTTSTFLKPMATITPSMKPLLSNELASAKLQQLIAKVPPVPQYAYPPKDVTTSVTSNTSVQTATRVNDNTTTSTTKVVAGAQNTFSVHDFFKSVAASSGLQSTQPLPETTVCAALSALSTASTKVSSEKSSLESSDNVGGACASSENASKQDVDADEGKGTMIGEDQDEHEEEEENEGEEDTGEGEEEGSVNQPVEEARASGSGEEVTDSAKPFTEGVTAREDRLRKLKELLREKQKAVDEIRATRVKDSDD